MSQPKIDRPHPKPQLLDKIAKLYDQLDERLTELENKIDQSAKHQDDPPVKPR